MALKDPAAVHDTTETAGQGSYTLLGGDPTARRSLADAVTNGDAANGDTVWYYCSDDTTGGASALDFEWGIGTISSSGAVLSRDTIYQSSNGGLKVSWGSGGTRDIVISSSLDGLPKLADANTWTAVNTFGEAPVVLKDAAGAFTALTLRNNAASSTANKVQVDTRLNTSVAHRSALVDIVEFRDVADATRTSKLTRSLMGNGSFVNVFALDGLLGATITGALAVSGAITQGGTAVALAGVLSAPAGTRLLIGNAAAPSGWTIVASLADRTIMLTSTQSEIDDTGGSWTTGITASTTVNGHTLTEAEMPAHSHGSTELGFITSDATGSFELTTAAGSDTSNILTTATTGGGGSHSHTASTSISSTSYRPAYYKAAFYQKS